MPTITVVDMDGKKVSDMELNETVFGIEPNVHVMHLAVVNYLANQRQGTQSTKTRAEVSGGGRKPWRQKGTGSARQGSKRAPQWTHGGIALGPKPRSYRYSLGRGVRQLAIRSALSDKAKNESLVVLDKLDITEFKTKKIRDTIQAICGTQKVLLVFNACGDENKLYRTKVINSARNIPGVKTAQANAVNAYDILNADTLILAKDAVSILEEVYA